MKMIPVNTPSLGELERQYLLECIDTGWISSEGPFVTQFENEMANFANRQFGIAVSNGTAALEIAAKAIGITEGDEVIIPSFTIISPAQAISKLGAKPILVDSNLDTWNMDVSQIKEKITTKTKAIIAVHIYGLPIDMDPLLELCKKYNLKLIEDAAEMHGQTYKGGPCGSFGDVSIFSFYPNKHITTGEGGMIVTNDYQISEKCKSYRNLCFRPEQRFVHDEIGWNYRMTNMQAALGVAQLKQIDQFLIRKREIGNLYQELLAGLEEKVIMPLKRTDYAENIYWVFGMILKDTAQLNAKEMMTKLSEFGIGSRPFFFPMHQQPVFNNQGWYLNETYPNAELMAENGFYVPSGLGIKDYEIKEVARIVREILA
jgi:perosamine synthetase